MQPSTCEQTSWDPCIVNKRLASRVEAKERRFSVATEAPTARQIQTPRLWAKAADSAPALWAARHECTTCIDGAPGCKSPQASLHECAPLSFIAQSYDIKTPKPSCSSPQDQVFPQDHRRDRCLSVKPVDVAGLGLLLTCEACGSDLGPF